MTGELIRAGVDTVVAAGGDGTVNAVVNGMVGTDCRLGIIPVGTANDLAAGLDIPPDVEEACGVVLEGTALRIDVIRVNSWHFVTAGGIGLPVDVVETVGGLRRRSGPAPALAQILGPALYPLSMAYHLFRGARTARTVDVELDDRKMRLRVVALLVANLRSVGRYMQIAPQASLADGLLHLFVLEATGSRLALVSSALRTLNGSAARGACVRMLSGRRLTLNTEGRTSFCADGELGLRGSTFKLEVVPEGINVICPVRHGMRGGPQSCPADALHFAPDPAPELPVRIPPSD